MDGSIEGPCKTDAGCSPDKCTRYLYTVDGRGGRSCRPVSDCGSEYPDENNEGHVIQFTCPDDEVFFTGATSLKLAGFVSILSMLYSMWSVRSLIHKISKSIIKDAVNNYF